MSSSGSSSSHTPRTPLHERSNSENNKLQIRLVPYTPPKARPSDARSRGSGVGSAGSDVVSHTNKDRTSGASESLGKERFIGSAFSSPPSSSPPSTSSTWGKGKGVSESSRLVSESSVTDHPDPPRVAVWPSHGNRVRQISAPTKPLQQLIDQRGSVSSSSPSTRPPSRSRRNTIISINSDKTFSLLKATNTRVSTGSESTAKSYHHSNTSYFSSHEGTPFDAHTDDQPSSLFSAVPERSVSPSSTATSATISKSPGEPAAPSPWNYRMSGGLRKVPKTPDSKNKGKAKEVATEPFPLRLETTATVRVPPSSSLALKTSFTTENSDSTLEETANYKIIGRSSPPRPDSVSLDASSSSGSSNYQVFGPPSAPQSFNSSPTRGQSVLDTPGSKNFVVHHSPYRSTDRAVLETPGSRNFVVHSNSSSEHSASSGPRAPRNQPSYDSLGRQTTGQYSQESLVIPPLRPHKRSESENLYLNRNSRDTLHGRSTSFSSISSVLTQDTGPNVVRLTHTPSASSLGQAPWAGRSIGGPAKSRMDVHQWSSQLSPVMSEYEGSDRTSGLMSIRSSGGRASGNLPSVSPSLFETLESTQTRSRSGSFDQLGTAYMRSGRELPVPPPRTVRHHDEHGDGLADLRQIHEFQSNSSRTRLGFLSRHSSDRSSHSTSSSRAGSLTTTSLPTWARVYYGSGERRWLASASVISEGDDDSRPTTSRGPGGSPPQQFGEGIRNPRRRPRESQHDDPQILSPEPAAISGFADIRRIVRKQTSSIWSPHLRPDRRISRYSMWQPPAEAWAPDHHVLGRRNIQVVSFVAGFIFPLAWMIAAFLPLPPKPQFDIPELQKSTIQFQKSEDTGSEPLHRRVAPIDDLHYQSANWWRNLNRYMSILGLLILGAIAALIVVGINQGWGK